MSAPQSRFAPGTRVRVQQRCDQHGGEAAFVIKQSKYYATDGEVLVASVKDWDALLPAGGWAMWVDENYLDAEEQAVTEAKPITWTTLEQPKPVESKWRLYATSNHGANRDATDADLRAAGYVPAAEADAHFDRVARVIRAMNDWTPECRAGLVREIRQRWNAEWIDWERIAKDAERERDAAVDRAEAAEQSADTWKRNWEIAADNGKKAEADRDSLRAELDRVRPVVMLAKEWRHETESNRVRRMNDALTRAVDALSASTAGEEKPLPESGAVNTDGCRISSYCPVCRCVQLSFAGGECQQCHWKSRALAAELKCSEAPSAPRPEETAGEPTYNLGNHGTWTVRGVLELIARSGSYGGTTPFIRDLTRALLAAMEVAGKEETAGEAWTRGFNAGASAGIQFAMDLNAGKEAGAIHTPPYTPPATDAKETP